ncbi:MAG TPA: cellulase family glycosylhydrolase [Planctomycetota bacterium]|nr:cellulase family glycosylhydrolase [Planctomycetota bacterium]
MKISQAKRTAVSALLIAVGLFAHQAAAADFVSAGGKHFMYRDARFYYAGTNCYYLSYFCADPLRRESAENLLDLCRDRGFNVIRIWAFNDGGLNIDGYPNEWAYQETPSSTYNENALGGLDYALDQARIRGLKLILTFTNNWDDYGGMNWYVYNAPTASTHDQFYTNTTCKNWLKARIWNIVNRVNTINGIAYKDDPTIFAWELANEPRAWDDAGCTNLLVRNWASTMSAYVKSLDSNHMVTIGMEGFYNSPTGTPRWLYNGSEGTDFVNDHKVSTIDFCTVHVYPDHWNLNETDTTAFLQRHITDATNDIQKPLILEEFGKQGSTRDATLERWTDAIYNDALAGGASAGWNIWMIEAEGSGHDDGFSLILPEDASAVNLLTTQAQKINRLTAPAQDVNADGVVNILDLILIRNNLNRQPGSNAPVRTDVNGDGRINVLDLIAVRNALNTIWP